MPCLPGRCCARRRLPGHYPTDACGQSVGVCRGRCGHQRRVAHGILLIRLARSPSRRNTCGAVIAIISLSHSRLYSLRSITTPYGMLLIVFAIFCGLACGTVTDVIPCQGERAVACKLGGSDRRTSVVRMLGSALTDVSSRKVWARMEIWRLYVAAEGSS